jgi:hypothetical protein
MGEKRNSVTYFAFNGGLNTNSSLLNTPPEDATDISNIVLESNGSVRRRRGVKPLPAKFDSEYFVGTNVRSPIENAWIYPVVSSHIFKITLNDGTRQQCVAVVYKDEIRINVFNGVQNIGGFDNPLSTYYIKFPNIPENAYYYPTRIIDNSGILYIISQYRPLTEINYNEKEDIWQTRTIPIFERDLADNPDVDSYVTHGGKTWKCIKTHDPSNSTIPGESESWETYWELVGSENTTYDKWAPAPQYSEVKVTRTVGYTDPENEKDYTAYITTIYRCKKSHTSAVSTYPPSNPDFWEVMSNSVFHQNKAVYSGLPEWEVGVNYSAFNSTYTSNVQEVSWAGDGFNPGFKAGCFSVGRLWLANHPGKRNAIYFSRVVKNPKEYHYMFQFADPYNTEDSELVDTDGGMIELAGAGEIVQLQPFRGGVIALADNGIWYIAGSVGSSFTATNYSIEKISDEGLVGPAAVADVEESVVYASYNDIYVVALGQVSGIPEVKPISIKISDLWRDIEENNKASSLFLFDTSVRKLYIYTNIGTVPEVQSNIYTEGAGLFTSMLILDIQLGAWYKFDIDPGDFSRGTVGNYPQVVGGIPYSVNEYSVDTIVVEGNPVVATLGAIEVGIIISSRELGQALETHFVVIGAEINGRFNFCFGYLEGDTFRDFEFDSDILTNPERCYTSFIETAPMVFNDVAHKKQSPYLYTVFRRVETGVDPDTNQFLNPGSCYYRVLWDWATSANASKYGPAYQAYKPRLIGTEFLDGRDTGYSIVRSKHRIRGRGDTFQIRFESEDDKDFHLLGFQADIYVTPKV